MYNLLVHCDNQAVVAMINRLVSSCKNCMKLIRILTLDGLVHNRKLSAIYVTSKDNYLADSLSRGQMHQFRKLGPDMNDWQNPIHVDMWPLLKLWVK